MTKFILGVSSFIVFENGFQLYQQTDFKSDC
jgi:hypothetical protein